MVLDPHATAAAYGSFEDSELQEGTMVASSDAFQKQPLLCDVEVASLNGVVRLELPTPTREEPRFPKEKCKTLVAALFLTLSWIVCTASLAMVHERLPDRHTVSPLPDIVLDSVKTADWALGASEGILITLTLLAFLLVLLHRHRYIILRRACFLLGLLYLMRALTMFVTVLPVASHTYMCAPKANSSSAVIIIQRVIRLMSGMGLSINGNHVYCGDYIYSGHTVVMVMACLVIQEYSWRRLLLLHWACWIACISGVTFLLISRGHYTVDVIIAYYVTTRIFWIYHTMAANMGLKLRSQNNYLCRVWWYCIFKYLEGNVGGIVPFQLEWPLPSASLFWSSRCLPWGSTKPPNRNS